MLVSGGVLVAMIVLFYNGDNFTCLITTAQSFPSMILLGDDRTPYLPGKIWTEIYVHSSVTPGYMLDDKFRAALRAAPTVRKWIIVCPADLPGAEVEFRGARYPSDDITEHTSLISTLRQLFLQDRLLFTDIAVLDTRAGVNTNGIIRREDIIRNMIFCSPGASTDRTQLIKEVKLTGDISKSSMDIGGKNQGVFKCIIRDETEKNIYKHDTLVYFRMRGSNELACFYPFYDRMKSVHNNHIIWISNQSSIDRESFIVLANTYGRDRTLCPVTFNRLVDMLTHTYAEGQWNTYMCQGNSPLSWCGSSLCPRPSIHKKMEDVYAKHLEWLESLDQMDYTTHKMWSKIYTTDPFMDYDWKFLIKHAADECLRQYIASIDMSLFQDCYQLAAIEYSHSIISVHEFSEGSNILALPHYMW